MQRHHMMQERPLAPRDYDLAVGWWGWNWEPPVPMSVTELLAAGNLDARTAALAWLVLEAHGSLLIAAEPPHSGKTTTLTAFLDFLPNGTRRVFIRGWSETFDYLSQTKPERTILLANELSSHLPVYLWGPKAVRVFRTLRRGYALGSTLHADSAEEALAQLTGELGVSAADLALVDLLAVMRIYGTSRGGIARRLVSLHEVDGRVPLGDWDQATDTHTHDDAAQLELLCKRRRQPAEVLREELARRSTHLDGLVARRVRAIPAVRASLAAYRGESARVGMRGDPTE
ncbi:hypothetical protein BH18CHL2_BH18CHL2_02640 [soil metagenome]